MEELDFTVKNSNGEDVECSILHKFTKNNINYILYTDYELDENDELNVLASRFIIEDDKLTLMPIEKDEEWDFINEEWSKYYGKY